MQDSLTAALSSSSKPIEQIIYTEGIEVGVTCYAPTEAFPVIPLLFTMQSFAQK